MKHIFSILAIFYCLSGSAQNYQWAKSIGGQVVSGNQSNSARCVITDAGGNVYMTGNFNGNNVDFNPGFSTINLSTNTEAVFIAKYSPLGICTWAKGILGGAGSYGRSMALDPAGNVYVTGYFNGSNVDFDPGAGTALLSAVGPDIFLAKYDNNGNYVWARAMGGSLSDLAETLSLDPSGNIYIGGRFKSINADFDPGTGIAALSTAGNFDIFFAKYDNNGNYLWAKNIGSAADDICTAVCSNSAGEVLVTGYFYQSTVDFDPGSGSANLTALGTDIYFAKYDAAGNYLWAKSIPGSSAGQGKALAFDAAGNFFICGNFQGQNVDFDPGPGTATLTAGPAATSMFFARYDSGGNYLWAKSLPGATCTFLTKSASGRIYLTGGFSGSVDFDAGPGTAVLTATGSGSFFFSKYDALGNYILARSINVNVGSILNTITTDNGDNAIIAGSFIGSNIDFDPGPGTALLSAPGYYMCIGKYGYCSTAVANPKTICPGGNYTINGHTYTAAGLYTDTLYTASGCDSIVQTQLSVSGQAPVVSISSSGPLCPGTTATLTATGASSYTWSTGNPNSAITVTPTSGLQYVVTGSGAGGCTGSASISVLAVPILSISGNTLVCKGQLTTMTVSGAISYTWNSGVQTPVLTVSPGANTIYTVNATGSNGCKSQQSFSINVNPCLGLNANDGDLDELVLYPNPTHSELYYQLKGLGGHHYKITDTKGTVLAEGEQQQNKVRLDVSTFQPGFYLLLITCKGKEFSKSFVVE